MTVMCNDTLKKEKVWGKWPGIHNVTILRAVYTIVEAHYWQGHAATIQRSTDSLLSRKNILRHLEFPESAGGNRLDSPAYTDNARKA